MSNYQHERGWLDSEVFGNKPYSERSAWSWMIGEASINESLMFSSSVHSMAIKFQWTKNKVSRFLKKLEKCGMISCKKNHDLYKNIIIIINRMGGNHG